MTASDPRLLEVREEAGSVWLILDSGETFELAPQSVPASLPAKGESISSPLLAEIQSAAERKQVARRIFALLDRRLWPSARIRERLLEDGFSLESIDTVLDQMSRQDLYSDRHYARAWCRDCLAGKDVGRRYLVDKLRRKQVAVSIAQEAVSEILGSDDECERAERAAAKRWRRITGPVDRKAEAKLVRFLMGRGFDASLANRAVRRTRPPEDDSDLD